eukprot:COSAG05_NODE_12709_length_457_cov_2.124101_1_plen_84_part_01
MGGAQIGARGAAGGRQHGTSPSAKYGDPGPKLPVSTVRFSFSCSVDPRLLRVCRVAMVAVHRPAELPLATLPLPCCTLYSYVDY